MKTGKWILFAEHPLNSLEEFRYGQDEISFERVVVKALNEYGDFEFLLGEYYPKSNMIYSVGYYIKVNKGYNAKLYIEGSKSNPFSLAIQTYMLLPEDEESGE